MNQKSEIIQQTELAFDFIQKLYLETSYLIKEIEGILFEEEENFIIGKPSGYGITARSSTGIEANNVNLWLLRKFAVFFVPENLTENKGGTTITRIDENLKLLYLRIILNDKNIEEPKVYSGILYNIKIKPQATKFTKFEYVMGYLGNKDKVIKSARMIDYEDMYIKFNGKMISNNLFDLNNGEAIVNRIVKPSLIAYRRY